MLFEFDYKNTANSNGSTCLVSEWLRLLPFLGVLALLGYLAVRPFLPKKKQQKDSLINLKIQKENPKVVNEINIEDLCLTKAAYCRCWRSKTVRWPFTPIHSNFAQLKLFSFFSVLRFCETRDFSIVFSIESLYSYSLHFRINTICIRKAGTARKDRNLMYSILV